MFNGKILETNEIWASDFRHVWLKMSILEACGGVQLWLFSQVIHPQSSSCGATNKKNSRR